MSFKAEFSNSEMNLLLTAVAFYEEDLRGNCLSISKFETREEWLKDENVERYKQAASLHKHLENVCVEGEDPYEAGHLEGYALSLLDNWFRFRKPKTSGELARERGRLEGYAGGKLEEAA